MDPETRKLVKRLHADPDAPGSLEAVRSHLERIDQPKWLATVLDYWATKTRDRVRAGEALVEAARLYGPLDPTRGRAALERAVENHADAPGFAAAIAACYPGSTDALVSILAHRNEALRVGNAPPQLLGDAYCEYYQALIRRGHLDGHLEIVRALAETDPEAKDLLARMQPGGGGPVSAQPPKKSFDDDLDAFLDDDDAATTMIMAAPDPAELMRGVEADTEVTGPTTMKQALQRSSARPVREETRKERLSARTPAPRAEPAWLPPAAGPPRPERREEAPKAPKRTRPASVPPASSPPERLAEAAPRAESGESSLSAPPVESAPEPEPARRSRREPPSPLSRRDAPAPGVPPGVSFDPRSLRRFADEEEYEDTPMVGIDPRTVFVVGEPANAGELAVEVVRFRGDTCLGAQTLRAGTLGSADFPGTIHIAGGAVEIRVMDAESAVHVRADEVREAVGGNGDVRMVVGDRLDVDRGPLRYSVRFGFAPKTPTRSETSMPIAAVSAGLFFALLAHIALAVGIDYLSAAGMVNLSVEDRPQEEIFAEGLLAPVPPPPPPRPRPRRRVEREKAPPRETRTELSRTLRDRVRRLQNTRERSDDATENLLQRLTTPNAGTGQTLRDVTTNIQAIEGGPLAGGLTVSGVQSALEGVSGVNTASQPGSATVGSLGGTDAAGDTGHLTMRASGPVRGRVRAVSALGRQTGGSLSRSEVQRVINQNIGRIQRCYERQLISNPNITGRVTFGWTIRPNGRVSGVRQQTSTLGNTAVTSCISGVIRRMRFPRPQGGAVTISYPFMFQRAP